MRPIPAAIANKIKMSFQTKYNNADPRIELIFQRTKRFIEEGTALQPHTIREGQELGTLDLSMKRENRKTAPDMIYMIYVEEGLARVASTSYINAVEQKGEWEHLYDLGPAIDVATEFDGYWVRVAEDAEVCFDSPANWTHITFGQPWFFRVLPSGLLVAQQGFTGEEVILASSGVTRASAVRGWKNVETPYRDHGLIVAYIRNGEVRYRNLAEQEDKTVVWESEKHVEEFTGPVQSVAVFRTNDYRVGIIVEVDGEVKWAVTRRNWAGMGVPAEQISCLLKSYELALAAVMHTVIGPGPYPTGDKKHQKKKRRWGKDNAEKIKAKISGYEVSPLLWGVETLPVKVENLPLGEDVSGEEVGEGDGEITSFTLLHIPGEGTETIYLDGSPVENYTLDGKEVAFAVPPGEDVKITADYRWQNWGQRIRVTFAHGITATEGRQDCFTVRDEQNVKYPILATLGGEPWHPSPPPSLFGGTRELILKVADFNAPGLLGGERDEAEITVEYLGPGLKGEAGQEAAPFVFSFVAGNLVPEDIPPPEVEALWNE